MRYSLETLFHLQNLIGICLKVLGKGRPRVLEDVGVVSQRLIHVTCANR